MKKRTSRSKSSFFQFPILISIMIIAAILCFFYYRRQDGSVISGKKDETKTTQSPITNTTSSTSSSIIDANEETTQKNTTNTTEELHYTLETETPVLLLKRGESYSPKINITPLANHLDLSWKSDDSSIASVDSFGKVTAKKDGRAKITCEIGDATLSIYINIITSFPSKHRATLTLYNQNGKELAYRLYQQNGHDYSAYDSYLAWHGCATCSFTTILNAFHESYHDYDPSKVINTIEKEVANDTAWQTHHVKRSLRSQMPPSLSGITSMLKHVNIKANYVRTFEKKQAKEEILSHLKTGNPVIFEVRKKSNITGKTNQRWTNSVHTMIFLGTYTTTGEVLVCDSVNRRWYSDGQRVKVVPINDPMEYMFSCTTFETSTYYTKQSADGGYILIE